MPLASGARLGPYRIDAEIGAGGMGHVFRATDTRLDRAVAIKVLPQECWANPELRQRFEREARALSSLSHPNLCALYDVGELSQSGATVQYIVMELLSGETLRERLEAGPLGVRKALLWAAQIANGLAAAHQKGVIHRDLKPENVFITDGDLLKILDFGLATTDQGAGGRAQGAGNRAAVLRTTPGIVLGTAHYMSPEQVRGLPLDPRSDIFALGTLLYEMLTGRVPFEARSVVEIMNAILVDDPPELGPVPEAVEALVWRCLEKDPAQRFSNARDLAFALETAARSLTATPRPVRRTSAAARPIASRARVGILLALATTVVTATVLSRGSFDEPDPEPPRLRTLTWSGRDGSPAASPDGRLITYVSSRDGSRRIWLKQLADGTEAPLTAGPDDSAPRFSPDGSVILFTRTAGGASALHRVGFVGGEPRKLLDNAFDGDFSPDGRRVAFIRNRTASDRFSTLCIAPVDGGAVREIAASTEEELVSPRFSPDGTRIAITLRPHGTKAGAVMVIDLDSGERRVLRRNEPHGLVSGVAWTTDGETVIYTELEALAAVGLMRRRGSSALVMHDVRSGRARVLLRNPHSAADTVDIVGTGRIVLTEDATRQGLQEVSLLDARRDPPRWLSRGMSIDRQPAYARGGTSVVFTSDRGGNADVWELMLDNRSVRHLTEHSSVDWDPHPGPDGASLYWSSSRGGHFEIWTSSLDGAGAQQLTRDGVDAENPTLPTSGDWIYYDSSNPKTDGLWRIPRTGGEAQLVVLGETVHPSVSADGRYVAYERPEEGGASAIDVVRVADHRIFTLASGLSSVNALRAQWVGATHTIAFRARDGAGRVTVFTQDFRPGDDTLATRRQLLPADPDAIAETFAIAPDGTRAILSVIDEAAGLMIAEGVAGIE